MSACLFFSFLFYLWLSVLRSTAFLAWRGVIDERRCFERQACHFFSFSFFLSGVWHVNPDTPKKDRAHQRSPFFSLVTFFVWWLDRAKNRLRQHGEQRLLGEGKGSR